MIPLVCPHCHAFIVVDDGAAPQIGAAVFCPCLDHPPITKPVAMYRLRIPEGYELVRAP